MSITTSVPAITFADTGLTLPEETSILDGVFADLDSAFGGGLNPGLSTPQGQLAQSLTAIIGDKNDQIAEVANQIDPDKAAGRWQDAIGRIYFIDRIAAAGTVVTGTCMGLVGTLIPAGSVAQDQSGYLYLSLADATVSATGSTVVDFQCQTAGPIACPVGSLSRIYRAVIGWDSVTNATAGTEGVNVESRADFEYRRKNSVAANAVNSPQAVYAAVLGVDGVVDAYVVDNPKGAVVNMGATNYPLAAHSLFVAAAGGSASDIAGAIWSKKPVGCDYNGQTTANVTDMNYDTPRPTYPVFWVTPSAVPVYLTVTITSRPTLPSDITDLVRAAVVNAFNGADGGTRARIASAIYAGRYYAGVAATNSNVEIQSILLGTSSAAALTSLVMGIDQRPTLDVSNIAVNLV